MPSEPTIAERLRTVIKILSSVVDEIESREAEVTINPVVTERVEGRICLYCGDKIKKSERSIRGTHQRCYAKMKRQMDAGKITELEFMAAGSLLPATPGGRPISSVDKDLMASVIGRLEQQPKEKRNVNS